MVDAFTCAIYGDCRLSGVNVVRWVILPSFIDLSSRPYNTGSRPCDHHRLFALMLKTSMEV